MISANLRELGKTKWVTGFQKGTETSIGWKPIYWVLKGHWEFDYSFLDQ